MDSETWNSLGDYGKKKLDRFELHLIGKDKYDLEDIAIKYFKELVYSDYCYAQLKNKLKKLKGIVMQFVLIFWIISFPLVLLIFPYEPTDPLAPSIPPFHYWLIYTFLPNVLPFLYFSKVEKKLFGTF